MIQLPKLMLGEDLPRLIEIVTAIDDDYSPTVRCNAEDLLTAEPAALCLLAASFAKLQQRGQRAEILGLRSEVRGNLARLNVLRDWLQEHPQHSQEIDEDDSQSIFRACRVGSLGEANELANAVSREIARFVPVEDLDAVLEMDPSLARYSAVERPLGYIISELLDNSLQHGRAGGYSHARAWVAAQYYRVGDLLRVAVVDDGCGFLQSLKSHVSVNPKTHQAAISQAFQPFISCKRDVGLFSDATHQGIGLTVCRDLCLRAGGAISAASGTAWVLSPATTSERSRTLSPGYSGSVLMLSFHRRAITQASLSEILGRYQANENLPIRFI